MIQTRFFFQSLVWELMCETITCDGHFEQQCGYAHCLLSCCKYIGVTAACSVSRYN